MQFEATHRSAQALNLTPLIDMVFLLLVFFMLTAHFVKDEGLPVDLPEAANAESLDEQKPLEVDLLGSGRINLDGRPVPVKGLARRLAAQLSMRSEKRLVIRADKAASIGDSVAIMDAARQAGATGVDIVTKHP